MNNNLHNHKGILQPIRITSIVWKLLASLSLLTVCIIVMMSLCSVTIMMMLCIRKGFINKPFSYTLNSYYHSFDLWEYPHTYMIIFKLQKEKMHIIIIQRDPWSILLKVPPPLFKPGKKVILKFHINAMCTRFVAPPHKWWMISILLKNKIENQNLEILSLMISYLLNGFIRNMKGKP
jgi:hypothetical protein